MKAYSRFDANGNLVRPTQPAYDERQAFLRKRLGMIRRAAERVAEKNNEAREERVEELDLEVRA